MMIARTIASRADQVLVKHIVKSSTMRSIAATHSVGFNQLHRPHARFCTTQASDDHTMASVTDLLKKCVSQQRGLESMLPLRSVLISLRSQTSLTWSTEDLVNLAVTLCRTSDSYDRSSVWQALTPFVATTASTMDSDQLSRVLWSMQSLPSGESDQKWYRDLLGSLNSALEASSHERWEEYQVAMAVYCVPALNWRSNQVKALLRTLKDKARDMYHGTGTDATFVALHLLQTTGLGTREAVDLYTSLLEKCVTIRGTAPYRVSRELLQASPALPSPKADFRKQWSVVNSVDAGATMSALYGPQGLDTFPRNTDELCNVLDQRLGLKLREAHKTQHAQTVQSHHVQTALQRVQDSIDQSTAPVDARTLGMSLYGLQQLSSDVKHVRELLSVSARQLTDSSTDLYVQELQKALQGSNAKPPTRKLRKVSDPTRNPSST